MNLKKPAKNDFESRCERAEKLNIRSNIWRFSGGMFFIKVQNWHQKFNPPLSKRSKG